MSSQTPETQKNEFEGEESLDPNLNILVGESNETYPSTVNFSRELYSIFELKRRYNDRKTLQLDPDYQREDSWDDKQRCELIESILMGMPLPLFYFFADENGIWQVVDGRQRLTALFRFLDNEYKLNKELRILSNIRGKYFKNLEPREQGILEDYALNINLIKPPTPDRVKFDIFDRVNRGGTRLNNQEMRNAIYQGKSTELLKKLATSDAFIKVTEKSITSMRMKDRYIILRFIGFYLLNTLRDKLCDNKNKPIEYRSDIDDFLGKIMQFINQQNDDFVNDITDVFNKAMDNSLQILGAGCFRVSKYVPTKNEKNLPLNMALFESLAYLCSFDEVNINPGKCKGLINELFIPDGTFLPTVRMPVDSSSKVVERFKQMDNIIKVLCND
ncbi:MAG: hypothetical protein QG673_1244 [Pseudomonadota bacterium]|nr:hypothetical protein [Pseudomonadota bacterium]